jgi:predicted N-acyltransferase
VRTGTWAGPASPVLEIAGRFEDYMAKLASKHRANLRNRERRLAKMGEVRAEVVRYSIIVTVCVIVYMVYVGFIDYGMAHFSSWFYG